MDIETALSHADSIAINSDAASRTAGVLADEVRRLREQSKLDLNDLPLVQADNRNRVSLNKFTSRVGGSYWAVEQQGADRLVLTAVELVPKSMLEDVLTPTAADLLAAWEDASLVCQRWHTWNGGGDWGAVAETDHLAWGNSPPDQKQYGYRIVSV